MLEYFGISRSTYYARLASIKKGDKYAEEREAIRTLVAMNKGRYGYRRITIALHKLGIHINHKVVMRIMKEENLTCKVRLKKYRSYRGTEGKSLRILLSETLLQQSQIKNGPQILPNFTCLDVRFIYHQF